MTITKEVLQHCIDNIDAGRYWLADVEEQALYRQSHTKTLERINHG